MSKYAIQVENLGKEYIIGGAEKRYDSFREMLAGAITAPLRKLRQLGGEASEEQRFWALKDVSFNVKQGEVLGIIGRNGAGKSTLLKVLSRITSPTEGRVVTRGRIASLLEVGTGFHPELTGRENIFLNGALLGMSRKEIWSKVEEIIDFAAIEKFLDTPVKRYSSGMYVRLAFAVAAHLEPDILLIDEVLAVGDVSFQNKCLGKINETVYAGRTVIFVSHNIGMVQSICRQAVILEQGTIQAAGEVNFIIDKYLQGVRNQKKSPERWEKNRSGDGSIRLTSFCAISNGEDVSLLQTGQAITFQIRFEINTKVRSIGFRIEIQTIGGEPVIVLSTDFSKKVQATYKNQKVIECYLESLPLMPGCYIVSLVGGADGQLSDKIVDAFKFDVIEGRYYENGKLPSRGLTHVLVPHEWNFRILKDRNTKNTS